MNKKNFVKKNLTDLPLLALLLVLVFSMVAGEEQTIYAQTATPTPLWIQNGSNISSNNTGNVGVGTTNPLASFHVQRNIDGSAGIYLLNAGGGTASRSIFLLGEADTEARYGYFAYQGANSSFKPNSSLFVNAGVGGFHILSYGGASQSGGLITFGTSQIGKNDIMVERMRISQMGNVGIGTPNPQKTLDVMGSINATGTITGGTIQATYQDIAEWVPSIQNLSAGTVVVLDGGRTNHILASSKSYDTRIAGVISESPGIILGESGEGKLKVATTGRVKIKADASRGAISVGDLLVTSDIEGMAMKSVPVSIGGVIIHRPGTIIGKALEPLAGGAGEILVLLSLQ